VKHSLAAFALAGLATLAGCSRAEHEAHAAAPATVAAMPADAQTYEIACGPCQFGMKEVEGCKLAVRIDGKPYLLEGVNIDAHALGLCEEIKHATIAGELEDGRFVATAFSLKP
jgi:Family of unknown function (DUF6370)